MPKSDDVLPWLGEDRGTGRKAVVTTTFKVGRYYTCTMSIDWAAVGEGIRAEWDPDLPKRRLTKAEMRDYCAGRNAFLDRAFG